MNIPKLNIGGLIADIPIIQGGMGVGISGAGLAAAVANEGGVGVIAGVDIGYREPDFFKDTLKANLRAFKNEIRKARQLAPKGILGVNLMVAVNNYEEMARTAVQEGIDLIISGAGLPLDLPQFVKDSQTRIAPIVSSAKAANVIAKYWDQHYGRAADLIIVEGPEAGGHLGFSHKVLASEDKPSVIDIVKEVVGGIPVVAAGGIFTGGDIADCLKAGAAGVQMATRFVATDECDADIKFKEAYVNAEKEDIVIIESPVGMPGRAIYNKFIQKVSEQGDEIKGCFQCLKGCNPKKAPYCISVALINAVKGNVDEGLIFAGSNVHRVKKIVPVKELINELMGDLKNA
ncbi:nitronate monooxygenase family protein [Bacillota bacterium]